MEGGVQVLKDDSTSHCMAARDMILCKLNK